MNLNRKILPIAIRGALHEWIRKPPRRRNLWSRLRRFLK